MPAAMLPQTPEGTLLVGMRGQLSEGEGPEPGLFFCLGRDALVALLVVAAGCAMMFFGFLLLRRRRRS